MIADALGVTKAAVYHQYPAKDDIVLAAIEVELAKVEEALEGSAALASAPEARERVLRQVIELAVERRSMVSAVQHDPVIVRMLATHEPFRQLMDRLTQALTGGRSDVDTRVRVAMVSAAIGGVVSQPLIADLDDDTLAAELLRLARELLDRPD
jgi:AcrR family transcriptional regulator